MVTRKRLVAGGALAATLAIVPSGSAQAPGTTTLSLFEPANTGSFRIIDNAPKSPVKNPESKRYRFSSGDQLVFSEPVLNGKGGKRLGTLYAQATVMSGKRFSNVKVLAHGSYELAGGSQLVVEGVFNLAAKESRAAVTGGTGIYAGRRGELVSTTNADDSTSDVITLLP